ncbi:hypothetical protein JHE03_23220, partial [Pluralibacter gergoviae]|uniref:hypothetical protein n=1 Tax=Pluralibacter gergoviae TaxID=61647 RepID=UPI0019094992
MKLHSLKSTLAGCALVALFASSTSFAANRALGGAVAGAAVGGMAGQSVESGVKGAVIGGGIGAAVNKGEKGKNARKGALAGGALGTGAAALTGPSMLWSFYTSPGPRDRPRS